MPDSPAPMRVQLSRPPKADLRLAATEMGWKRNQLLWAADKSEKSSADPECRDREFFAKNAISLRRNAARMDRVRAWLLELANAPSPKGGSDAD
jgi:hypothetical protein